MSLSQDALNILIWLRIVFFLITGVCFIVISFIISGYAEPIQNQTKRFLFFGSSMLSFFVGIGFFLFIYYLHTDQIDKIILISLVTIWMFIIAAIYMREKVSSIEERTINLILSMFEKIFSFIKSLYLILKENMRSGLIKIIELVVVGVILYYIMFSGVINIDQYVNQNKYVGILVISLFMGITLGFAIVAFFILIQIIFWSFLSVNRWLKGKRSTSKKTTKKQAKTL